MVAPASGEADDIYRRNTFTSTFEIAATEQAYLKSRLHDMHRGLQVSSILMGSVYLLLGMVHFSNRIRWVYMAVTIPLFSLAGATRMPITKRCLGFRECECVVMAAYLAVLAVYVPTWNQIFNREDPASWKHETWNEHLLKEMEYSKILALDAVVTCVHLALPVRWKVIVWGDLLYVIGLIARGFMRPYPYRDLEFAAGIGLVFGALVCGASWGLRIQECTQRDLFSLVIHERTRKAEAEFRVRGGSPEREAPRGNSSAGRSGSTGGNIELASTFQLTVSEPNSRLDSLMCSTISESSSKKGSPKPPMQKPAERRELVNAETQTTDKLSAAAAETTCSSSSGVGAGSAACPDVQHRRPDRPPMMPQQPGEPPLFSPRQRAAQFYRTSSGSSDSSAKSESDSGGPPGLADCTATTTQGQLTAVLMLMEMLDVKGKSCCRFHSTAAAVFKMARKLKSGKCDHHWECNRRWQCSYCTCLLNYEPKVCLVCGVPSEPSGRLAL